MAVYTYSLSSSWILFGGKRYFPDVDFLAESVLLSFRAMPKDELKISALKASNLNNPATVETEFTARKKSDVR